VRLWLALFLLLAALSPASARLLHFMGGSPPAGQSIASVSPSTGSYTSGASSGTVIAAVAVTLSPMSPLFTGTLSLTGTAAADFSLSSTTLPANLTTNGSTPTCGSTTTLNLNIVATQAGLGGSPYTQAVVVTCNPAAPITISAIQLSQLTFATPVTGGAATGITIGLAMTSGSSNGATFALATQSGCTSTNNSSFAVPGTALPSTVPLNAGGSTVNSGSYTICLQATLSGATNSPFYQSFNITGSNVPTATDTRSVYNSAGSSTPVGTDQTCMTSGDTCFAWSNFKGFADGQIPSGDIAVPSIGATAIRYQADSCVFWNDGSLMGCRFKYFLPQLAAGATEQITYTATSGSYDHTSSCTISTITCVTGSSDYKVHITNDNQMARTLSSAWGNTGQWVDFGFYVSGGSVTSGYLRHPEPALDQSCNPCGTMGPFTMSGCSTTNAQYTITSNSSAPYDATAITITNPGAGCPGNTTGLSSGNGTCDFNTIAAGGSGTTLQQTEEGQLEDTFVGWGAFLDDSASTPDTWLHCKIIVERWKYADGTTYAFRAVAMVTNGVYINHGSIPMNDYDADWMNGSTEIRGASDGSTTTWTRIYQYGQTGWATLRPDGRPDWSANSDALNAVISTFTTADKLDLKGSELATPCCDETIPISTKTLSATGNQSMSGDEGSYYPLCYCNTDSVPSWEEGGSHLFLAPMPYNYANYYLAVDSASDKGLSFLQNIRLSAIGTWGAIGGSAEPATGYPVNMISSTTYPLLTPTRTSANSLPLSGIYDMQFVANGAGSVQVAADQGGTPVEPPFTHFPSTTLLADYLIEGDPLTLEMMTAVAGIAQTTPLSWAVTLNGTSTTYNPVPWMMGQGTRGMAWTLAPIMNAARFLPSSRPEQPYLEAVMKESFTFLDAYWPYVGSMNVPEGTNGTKSYDMTGLGILLNPNNLTTVNPGVVTMSTIQWQDSYLAWEMMQAGVFWGGKYSDILTDAGYFMNNYQVPNTDAPCAYDYNSYVEPWAQNEAGLPNTNWCSNIACSTVGRYNVNVFFGSNFDSVAGTTDVYATTWNWANGEYAGNSAGGSTSRTTAAAGIGTTTMSMDGAISAVTGPTMVMDCGSSGCGPGDNNGAIPPNTVATISGSTVALSNAIVSPGVASNDTIMFSGWYDYPTGSRVAMPALSLIKPVNVYAQNEGTPNPYNRGTWPPPPLSETGTYYWCPDATYPLLKGTLSTTAACPGTPVTFTESDTWSAGFVVNASCPAISNGTWEGSGSYLSYDGRFATSAATMNMAHALGYSPTQAAAAHTLMMTGVGGNSTYANYPMEGISSTYGYGP